MKVTVIGSGKVARNLMIGLKRLDLLESAYARNGEIAKQLSEDQDIPVQDHLDFSKSSSKIFLMAVSDSVISDLADRVELPAGAVLVHTSGTVGLEALGAKDKVGVIYPLMTFAEGQLIPLSEVPLLIEGSDLEVVSELKFLGKAFGSRVEIADSELRARIHLAAVFASNFTNRMLHASEEILKEQGLDLKLLRPLVLQTLENVFAQGAELSLTGPAKRKDRNTIETQINALAKHPDFQQIYELLSNQIMK